MYKDFILSLLENASTIANNNFGKVLSTTKEDDNNQVLTQTDLEIGRLLVDSVKKNYPEHNIIDEETGVIDNTSEFTWVIDPIDGTSNFASGVPTYGIMIGLLHQNTPIVGGIALPYFSEIYFAEKGQGAYCNGKRVTANTEPILSKTLVAYCIDGHQENPELTRQEMKIMGEIVLSMRNLRTSNSAYDIMQVAKGSYGAYINKKHRIWDNVAPHIILEEAGCIVTDFLGKPFDYANPTERTDEIFTFCSAPVELHKQLQDIIHKF